MNFLKSNWLNLTARYTNDDLLAKEFLDELITKYSANSRHYHNLKHIEQLLKLTIKYKKKIKNPDTIHFAIWYHDAIYDCASTGNENKSACLASEKAALLGFDKNKAEKCHQLILATKSHRLPDELDDFDSQFFLDIDLAILGAGQAEYSQYTKAVRKEYNFCPNSNYYEGRKKVIESFLDRDYIYQTSLLRKKLENNARINLKNELSLCLNFIRLKN
ncbi:MAG: hypothetical protein GY757_52185 [bacterium]|nr:hypothetical protein [bacterium]